MITQAFDRNGTSPTGCLLRWRNSQVSLTLTQLCPKSFRTFWTFYQKPGMRETQGKCQRLLPVVKTLLLAGSQNYIDWDWWQFRWSQNGVDCIAILLQWKLPQNVVFVSAFHIFFSHRLYAGSSNTVAPTNSQGFQVSMQNSNQFLDVVNVIN